MTDQEHLDFIASEGGMAISAGGPPLREVGRPADADRLTLDLSAVPPAERSRIVGAIRRLIADAARPQDIAAAVPAG